MTGFSLALLLALAQAPDTGEDCGEQVCIYANDRKDNALADDAAGSWKTDAHLNRKQRRAEARKQRKRKDLSLRVELNGGRASVFVDGRYLASEGAHAQRDVKPGKHEVEVRDGEDVIAVGVVTIGRKAGAVTLVVHADR